MKSPEIRPHIYHRAFNDENIAERHASIMAGLAKFGGPFGLAGLEAPPVPEFGKELYAGYWIKNPAYKGVGFSGGYNYRSSKTNLGARDKAVDDEILSYRFKTSNPFIDYKELIYNDFMKAIAAFDAYRALWIYSGYWGAYRGGYEYTDDARFAFDKNGYEVRRNERYNKLKSDESIDVDGRNNIFTLHPAQFWDAELCRRALGYGPDEVVKRLTGKALKVERLGDGVYTVLNDNPHMSFNDFLEMNRVYKDILGLY